METRRVHFSASLFVAMVLASAHGRAIAASADSSRSLSAAARTSLSRAIGLDPFFPEGTLTAFDGAENDAFGSVVSIDGDTVVVGSVNAAGHRGAVYVFVKPAAGWESTSAYAARLTASDSAAGDEFGGSVAISGDTVVVGAHQAKIGAKSEQGAVYVYVKPAAGWTSTSAFDARLTSSDGAASDAFGRSVAIEGETVVAGAPGASDFRGAAYVFAKPVSGWSSTSAFSARLTASDGASGDELGASVAISSGTIVAGTPGSNGQRGAAYVFVEPVQGWATTSAFTAKLTVTDSGGGDEFGAAVAISGNTIAAGAPIATVGGHSLQGAAYVFVKPGTGWTSTSAFDAILTVSGGNSEDLLGASVAVSNHTVLAGASRSSVDSGTSAAYVFVMPAGGWATTSTFDAKLTSAAPSLDGFGVSIALSGDTAVVGAPEATVGAHPHQGAASLFGGFAPPAGPRARIVAPPPSVIVPVIRNP